MLKHSLISLFVLYLCFDNAYQYKVMEIKNDDSDKSWDLLIFTQAWPATRCKIWTHKNKHHSCVFPKQNDSWTVHGIWPTKLGTRGPENCNDTWNFDVEKVKPIENELEQSWTNVEKETSTYNLWAHEWTKHGTCAAQIEPLNDEYKYFSKGIEFLKKYHMTDALNAANILPSNTNQLNIDDIRNAVKSKYNIHPYIACVYEDGIQYLMEIRICFDKQLNLIACDGITHPNEVKNGVLTNCNINKPIVFPVESQAPSAMVQLYKFVNWLQWFTL